MPGRTSIIAGAAAALLCWAQPAIAADPAQMSCPVETLSGPEREALIDHVRRQGGADEPAMQAFFRSINACRSRHRWSEGAAQQSIMYNLANLGQIEARRSLEQHGIDMATIERLLLADRETVASARTEAAPERIQAFYEGLDPAIRRPIESIDEGEGADLLGTYLMFRAAMETSRADFAAE